jgi:hypothetical protein
VVTNSRAVREEGRNTSTVFPSSSIGVAFRRDFRVGAECGATVIDGVRSLLDAESQVGSPRMTMSARVRVGDTSAALSSSLRRTHSLACSGVLP